MPKKVVKKKLIGFDADMLSDLSRKVDSGYGKDETEVLRKLLAGEQQFAAAIEDYISEQQTATGFSREDVLQILILEALQTRDSRFRLSKEPPKKKRTVS